MTLWGEFKQAFDEDITRGPDDSTQAFYRSREAQDLDNDAPRLHKMGAEHPVSYRLRELLNIADPHAVKARQELGFGPKQTMAGKLGQLAGSIGADLIQDKSRSFWWLLNAAQAAGNVINEVAVGAANPDLYGSHDLGMEYDLSKLAKAGYAHEEGGKLVPNQDVRRSKKGNRAVKRNYRSGAVTALGIPAGFAINQGLGLMTPFGGYEGYAAVIPSEEDASKTDNVLAEIASKYILGRTGNLLPYEEFRKVRPDVDPGEYKAYKAFKFNKEIDMNPFDDGQMTLPAGVLKTTTEGIHGPEVQFLGRSLPVNTAVIPFLSAVAGTALGVRRRAPKGAIDPNAVRNGLIGGAAGTALGMTVGNLLEQERRNRNMRESVPKSPEVPEQGF